MAVQVDMPFLQDLLRYRAASPIELIAAALWGLLRLTVLHVELCDLFVNEVPDLGHVLREIPTDRDGNDVLGNVLTNCFLHGLLQQSLRRLISRDRWDALEHRNIVGERSTFTVEAHEELGHHDSIGHSTNCTKQVGANDPSTLGPNQLHLSVPSPENHLAKLTRRGSRAVAENQQILADKQDEGKPKEQHEEAPKEHCPLEAKECRCARPRHGFGHQVGTERVWLTLVSMVILSDHHSHVA
mmetsp:Transcript_55481/g.76892  ORF Transcript_55481/g.76892 Transcript_55481/m.76892 type:complete len:242 (-) Transcript_55481:215-940(-)